MKLTFLFVMISSFSVFASKSYSQTKTLNLKMQNATIKEVLASIEEQSQFYFMYSEKIIDVNREVDINIKNQNIEKILDQLFVGTNVNYTIKDRIIVLTTPEVLNNNFNAYQQKTVSGKVTDSSGLPLPGVAAVVKGTTNGTVTNAAGEYSLEKIPENAILQFSFVGLKTKDIPVGQQSTINVILEEETIGLDEVVAIGYGTVKKSDVTGSVSAIKEEDFNKGAIYSVDQLFEGKMSGVQVTQNSAEPGGSISVNVRGIGSINAESGPLYVIDGLPIDNTSPVSSSGDRFTTQQTQRSPLSSLNPSDIESIEILKDASATAIYGARGANGVVLIKTKTGSKNSFTVTYDAYAGVQNISNKLDLLSPTEYKDFVNDMIQLGAEDASSDLAVDEIQENGTDWIDEISNKNALITNHNLSLNGGTDKTQFLISANYMNQEGIILSSSYERFGLRLNLQHNVNDKFTTGVNINTSLVKDDFVPVGFATNEHAGVIYTAINFDPTISLKDEDGNYQLSPYLNMDNPVALAYGKDAKANTYRTFGTLFAEYKILPELSAKLNLGGDVASQKRNVYVDRTTVDGAAADGIATLLNGITSNYLVEGTFSYNKKIGKHDINAVAGATIQKFYLERFSAGARGFTSDGTGANNLGLGLPEYNEVSSSKSSHSLISYLARVNYTFNEKYLITAAFRADGSSRFGENNKFGYFPSAALGWKIYQEDFFQDFTHVVNNLKLRASYGITGNQEIGNYKSISTYTTGPTSVFDNAQIITTVPARIANPDLKWETTSQIDLGLDFGLFSNRIYGNIDWYQKHTYDMLLNFPIPVSSGFSSQYRNVGEMKNSGWEFSLSSTNIQSSKFRWSSTINLTTLKNEVTDLGGVEQILSSGIIKEGIPLHSFYGYEVEGIWQTNDDFSQTTDVVEAGDIKYKDQTGDKTVDANDQVVLGNSFPDFTWSFGNTLQFKNFEFYCFFNGVEGIQMLNQNLIDTYFPAGLRRNKLAEPIRNRWTEANPSNKYPSWKNPSAQGSKSINSLTVEDASYIRLSTVRLTYHMNLRNSFIKNLSLSVTGQNLFTITDYNGWDPTINPNGNFAYRRDWNAYPPSRTYMLGINVKF